MTGLSLHDDPTAGAEEDIEPLPMLQYHHKGPDESPVKKNNPNRISQATVNSIGSSSSGGGGLRPPRTSGPRVASQYSLGADLRASTYSPMSADDNLSVSGSPRVYARNQAGNRRSPDTRPMSYIDLLNDLPYSQQVAPAPMMNNISLQSAVGNNASLLDNKKTLDMYRANVKKTNDPSIQYEFAIFMINAARDHAEDTESAAELIKEARGILQRLSDRAYPFAQYYLADGYFSGLFNKDKPDYDKALPLFVAASKHGHAESGYRAALCYEFGWGCTKNYPKAVQFFRAAASKGHPGAAIRLGKACLTGDMGLVNRYREGVKWLKRATDSADYQYNSGPYELGLLHITGFGEDIFKDEAYAAQLMTKSAELGHAEANYRMGQAYENGTFGCPKDAALSVHFYNGAASKGLPEAMMALCAWYMVGAEPVLEKDEVEAYEWSKRAAELGKSTTPTSFVKLYANRIQQGSQRPSTPSDTLPKWASDAVVTLSKRMCGTSRLPTRATRRLNNDSTLLERQLLAILAYLWPRARPRQKSSVAARKRSASSCKFDETKRSF